MAVRKAEKTYPKPQGEEGHDTDDFVPPDRVDQIPAQDGDPVSEEVDVFEGGDDKPAAREEPAAEARDDDARSMRSDSDDDDAPPAERTRRPRRRGSNNGEAPESRSMRQRINRERALRRASDEQVTNLTAETASLKERLAKLEKQQTDVASNASVKQFEEKIAGLRTAMAQAIEDGDTAKQLDLNMQLSDAMTDLKLLKRDLADQASRRPQESEERPQAREPDAAVKKQRIAEFQGQNRWWGKQAFKDENADAVALDNDILRDIREGKLDCDPYSPEHFAELAHRMNEMYPDLEVYLPNGELYEAAEDDDVRDDDNVEARPRNRRPEPRQGSRSNGRSNGRAPMGGMGGREGRRQQNQVELARQGRVTLDENDFATMRRFNLDPNNPDHKKRFANERRRTILTGSRR